MNRFEYAVPTTVEQALEALKSGGGGVAKGGGVDLLDLMKERLTTPARLVNLGAITALRYVRVEDGALRLGATTTLGEIAAHPEIRARFAAVAQAAASAASPNLRNQATIAGNLLQRPRCWYFRHSEFPCLKKGGGQCFAYSGENRYHALFGGGPCYIVHPSTLAPPLVAFGAVARVVRAGEKPRELPVERLFSLPDGDVGREHVLRGDELITELLIPAPAPGTGSVFVAAKERQGYDWPLGEATVVLERRGPQIARGSVLLGAAAPVPWRAREAEQLLAGAPATLATAQGAGQAAVHGARPLADNGYKVALFQALVERAVVAAAEIGVNG